MPRPFFELLGIKRMKATPLHILSIFIKQCMDIQLVINDKLLQALVGRDDVFVTFPIHRRAKGGNESFAVERDRHLDKPINIGNNAMR